MHFWLFPDDRTVFLKRSIRKSPEGGVDTLSPPTSIPDSWRAAIDGEGLLYNVHVPEISPFRPPTMDGGACVDGYEALPGFVALPRRGAIDFLTHDEYHAMNRAFHYAHWHRNTRFCGRCGHATESDYTENAKVCPRCGHHTYPRISPAVIMAVVRDGKLLLAHGAKHPGNMFSVLAGFVEPGENLESCVSREIMEEVGVEVRNIRYFASQPWPFPESLMVGFTADWANREIDPDPNEIAAAGWFSPEDLPGRLPERTSVSRSLIEWFVSTYGSRRDILSLRERP